MRRTDTLMSRSLPLFSGHSQVCRACLLFSESSRSSQEFLYMKFSLNPFCDTTFMMMIITHFIYWAPQRTHRVRKEKAGNLGRPFYRINSQQSSQTQGSLVSGLAKARGWNKNVKTRKVRATLCVQTVPIDSNETHLLNVTPLFYFEVVNIQTISTATWNQEYIPIEIKNLFFSGVLAVSNKVTVTSKLTSKVS